MELRRRETGESFDLVDGMVFGRLDSCKVKVDDGSISRRHAEVKQAGRAFELVDLDSSNGIFQNGQRKPRFLLRSGDLVTLGAVAFDVIDQNSAAVLEGDLEVEEVVASAPAASTSAPASSVSESERARARLRRDMTGDGRSSGLGDLGQQPLATQLLIFAVGLGVMCGVVVGIRYLAGSL